MTTYSIENDYDCTYCYDGNHLCPGGPHPFGPCGDPKTCPSCGRGGTA